MVMTEEAMLSYSSELGSRGALGLDLSYVGSSYFGLKQLLASHCERHPEYRTSVEEDPEFCAAFCKTVVTRDDDPSFDDVRKRYDQLAKDMYDCMKGIPEGQMRELSRSPHIYASRTKDEVRIESGASKENFKDWMSDKQYSDSVLLLAYFMVENNSLVEDAEPLAYEPVSRKDTRGVILEELEAQRQIMLKMMAENKSGTKKPRRFR